MNKFIITFCKFYDSFFLNLNKCLFKKKILTIIIMKLFEKDIAKVLDYLKLPLVDNEAELELIFGVTPYKIPLIRVFF